MEYTLPIIRYREGVHYTTSNLSRPPASVASSEALTFPSFPFISPASRITPQEKHWPPKHSLDLRLPEQARFPGGLTVADGVALLEMATCRFNNH